MSAYPGHHAIAAQNARALATHYRDTEDLVGVLVEMANIIDDLPEHDRQVAERARVEFADELTRKGVHTFDIHSIRRAAKGEQ